MEPRIICGREVLLNGKHSVLGLITFHADFDSSHISLLEKEFPDLCIASVKIGDWNNELSPWAVPDIMNGFGDGAQGTLDFIVNHVIPEMGCERIIIGGYSLAGLFSLWACYNSDKFSGCAASSPSVWFPGWKEYIDSHKINAGYVYLSLGKSEHKTKNSVMKTVSEMIVLQKDILESDIGEKKVKMEWNEGGHFDGVAERVLRSFIWAVGKLR